MLRRWSCVIALAVVLVGLPTAQAAETMLTLTCAGTTAQALLMGLLPLIFLLYARQAGELTKEAH